jgi:hypothetical protein
MKLKEVKLDLFGLELKIQLAASQKAQEKNPGKMVVQSVGEYLTPVKKEKKIRHINEL